MAEWHPLRKEDEKTLGDLISSAGGVGWQKSSPTMVPHSLPAAGYLSEKIWNPSYQDLTI